MRAENPAKIVSAVLADGKTLIRQPDGAFREADGATDWERVAALTAAEVEAAARADAEASVADAPSFAAPLRPGRGGRNTRRPDQLAKLCWNRGAGRQAGTYLATV